MEINEKLLKKFYASCDDTDILSKQISISNGGLKKVSVNNNKINSLPFYFNVELKQGNICNQKQSGRCWLFAACNFMRSNLIKKYNLDTFELSQTYLFFYDKLEKSNYFLESIIKTKDEQVHSRLLDYLLTAPVGDGGQWDMVVDLVEKYGIVPKYAMGETVNSSASREMDSLLTTLLRQDAYTLREMLNNKASEVEINATKENFLQQIYQFLVMCLGKPPVSFDFVAKDKNNKNIEVLNCTPLSFYHDVVGIDLKDYISLLNAPTSDKPYNKTFTVAYLGNVVEGRGVKYLNLNIEELKKATVTQLKNNEPVWFGSDVGYDFDRDSGYAMKDIFAYKESADVDIVMDKPTRLDYCDSAMNHAMVIHGVNCKENGEIVSYKIENSWGDSSGMKGYYIMDDKWFDAYVYQIVVNKKYLSKELVALYNQDPIVLQPWDPCGSLALCK